VEQGANIDFTPGVGASGKLWFCDGLRIYEVNQRPPETQLYKTYSVYYIGGVGFSVLKGDARKPPIEETWHPLQFAFHKDASFSSYLTNAGQAQTIRFQPQDRRWADLLLPSVNHSADTATSPAYGGLVGELPLFLALMAFSTSREYLPSVLPYALANGSWVPTHFWKFESRSSQNHRCTRLVAHANLIGNPWARCRSEGVELWVDGLKFPRFVRV
jgi:hypothetical protein